MDPTLRMIANLTGEIVSKIRVRFGVVPGMTPTKVLALSDAVGILILDHMSRLHDVTRSPTKTGTCCSRPLNSPRTGDFHMASKKKMVHLFYNDEVTIVLMDGRMVSIVLSYLEPGDQDPEIDIKFDKDFGLNCIGANLSLAKVTAHRPNVLEDPQIIIPLERYD
jgi:hypothetical protein